MDRVCELIEHAAPVLARELQSRPGEARAIGQGGEAMSRACLVRGDSRGSSTIREQRAMREAFDSYLSLALAAFEPAGSAPAAPSQEPWLAASGMVACLVALAWSRRRRLF